MGAWRWGGDLLKVSSRSRKGTQQVSGAPPGCLRAGLHCWKLVPLLTLASCMLRRWQSHLHATLSECHRVCPWQSPGAGLGMCSGPAWHPFQKLASMEEKRVGSMYRG